MCGGDGRTTYKRNLMLNIPPGVEDSTPGVRLSGEGEAGLRGGTEGDLYVFISIRKHLKCERDGTDLKLSWPISSIQAELGDNIKIPFDRGMDDIVESSSRYDANIKIAIREASAGGTTSWAISPPSLRKTVRSRSGGTGWGRVRATMSAAPPRVAVGREGVKVHL